MISTANHKMPTSSRQRHAFVIAQFAELLYVQAPPPPEQLALMVHQPLSFKIDAYKCQTVAAWAHHSSIVGHVALSVCLSRNPHPLCKARLHCRDQAIETSQRFDRLSQRTMRHMSKEFMLFA